MKRLLFFFLFVGFSTSSFAQQSWQWGKRGGGSKNESTVGAVSESVIDMATDPNGNVYTLSNLLFNNNDVDVNGQPLNGRDIDIVISSFGCNGTFRWAKVIGSPTLDFAIALKTDALGGVYITGVTYGTNTGDVTKISTDTSFGESDKTMFLVKYDSSGVFKWFRQPQPDTAGYWTSGQRNYALDMDVDKTGNSYSMCHLSKGNYGRGTNSYSVTTPGVHMLRYSKDGDFLGGSLMTISIGDLNNPPVTKWWLTRTSSGKFIVTGTPSYSGTTLKFGTTPIDKTGFAASFNANGSLNWVKQSNLTIAAGGGNTFFTKATIDGAGSIYLAGTSSDGDGFGGAGFSNPKGGAGISFPVAFKLDSNGNTIWSRYSNTQGGSRGTAGALTTNGEFVLGGGWSRTINWVGYTDSISHPLGWLQHVFLTRFNAQTGVFMKMDTLYSPASDNQEVTSMTADKAGNVYLGGSFQTELKVAGTSLRAKQGGYFDFFVAKYGTANCKAVGVEQVVNPASGASLLLAPNPSTTETQISYQLSSNTGNLEVYDLAGRMLFRKALGQKTGTEKLSIAEYVPGLYLVVLREAGEVVLHRRLSVAR